VVRAAERSKRIKPTAQAVGGAQPRGSPEGAKEINAAHHHESLGPFHLQHQTTLRSHKARIREGTARLPRRYRPSNWRDSSLREWNSRSRPSFDSRTRPPFHRRYRSSHKNELFEMGARALARISSFCMANRLRGVYRQRIGSCRGSGIHFKAARPPQSEVVSGGVFSVFEEEWNHGG
jgi:hypothetical protein